MMKALVYQGPGKKAWTDITMPALQKATDVIVKIKETTICGTDLHILKGDTPEVPQGLILGHEGLGSVVQAGDAVSKFKEGDDVIISCISSCGTCDNCKRLLPAHCDTGGWILGHLINGTQAEYVRIPYGDNSLYKIPPGANRESMLMLSDILPTGFEMGVQYGDVKPGDTIAIVGAGPVGMATLMTSQFYSPGKIIMIDMDAERLVAAKNFGATDVILVGQENATEKVMEMTGGKGVDVAIEAVGLPQTFATCQSIIGVGGNIANVGVHGKPVSLELQDLWIKNLKISAGLVNATTTGMLLKALSSGRVDPSKLVTHRFKLNEIEQAYDVFGNAAKTKAMKILLTA